MTYPNPQNAPKRPNFALLAHLSFADLIVSFPAASILPILPIFRRTRFFQTSEHVFPVSKPPLLQNILIGLEACKYLEKRLAWGGPKTRGVYFFFTPLGGKKYTPVVPPRAFPGFQAGFRYSVQGY